MHVHLALARFMFADVAGARGEPGPGATRSRRSLDFPQGPWSAAYAAWLGSWMWIEAGRLDLAEAAVAELQRVERPARVRRWELIADDADCGARGHRARCGRRRRTRPS